MGFRDHPHNFLALAQARLSSDIDGMAQRALAFDLDDPKALRETLYAGVGVLLGLAAMHAHQTGRKVEDVLAELELRVRDAGDSLGTEQ